MSGLGRALAGLGAGAAGLASRYIDEELAQQRAQALSDIQFANAKRTEEFEQSEAVQGRRMVNQRKALEMQNEVALRGKVAEASSTELRDAKIDNEVAVLKGTTPARIAAENAVVEGTAGTKLDAERTRRLVLDQMDVKRAGGIADAQWNARGNYDLRLDGQGGKGPKMSEAGKLQLQDVNKQDEALQKSINDGIAGGTLKQDPSDPAWQHFSKQKQGLQVQKLRIYAREGLVSGSEDAANLIGAGATPDELLTSAKQAKLIGGRYAAEFESAVKDHMAKQPGSPAVPPKPEPQKPVGGGKVDSASAEPVPVRTLFSKAANWVTETGRDYSTQEGKAALRQRVAEAQSGGQPLTRVEQMRAQQLGLI